MTTSSSPTARPFDGVDNRLIYFHGKFGTITLSIADAEAAAIALAWAVERARDMTPLKVKPSKEEVLASALAKFSKTLKGQDVLKELGLL